MSLVNNDKLADEDIMKQILAIKPPPYLPIVKGDYKVRLAENEEEIAAAQRLRYDIFYLENGAIPNETQKKLQRDIDKFDPHCDHLLVLHHDVPVGTYRLMRRQGAEKTNGFLSSEEYDLQKLIATDKPIVEMSRACIAEEHRLTTVIQLLWKGLAFYVLEHEIKYMFGCASFHGTDVAPFKEILSYLHYNHTAPDDICPKALADQYVDMCCLPESQVNAKQVAKQIPTLMRGYLRMGGWVGSGAVVDPVIRTVDVLVVVDSANIAERYYKHYLNQL